MAAGCRLGATQGDGGVAVDGVVNARRSYLGGAGLRCLRCEICLDETIICFSCKTRQSCPSRAADSIADCAAPLVDKVLLQVPTRQYLLSLPFETWGVLAFRPKLTNAVQKAFIDCAQAATPVVRRSTAFPAAGPAA
ncbi:MAG: transposase zinc-binding domain-containing protein [Deltaproteobacteria bacterium]|nr:transposase zinc-binding domain-containing protein [Deltaproteobacteria bacterium]